MKRYGLIGYPLSHSFSQKFFSEKFEKEGITGCVYENHSISDISELKQLLAQKDIFGLNVTIPYKKAVIDFLTDSSEIVTSIGACNCIDIRGNVLTGYNTDVIGFEKSIAPYLRSHHTHALVFGTGGASAAVAYVLGKLAIPFQYVSRSGSAGALSYADVTEEVLSTHHLLINTTPLGMYPKIHENPDIPYQYLADQHHLYDLVYNPAETKFLEKGRLQGATTQNGLEMLVLQAEESWRIWNAS